MADLKRDWEESPAAVENPRRENYFGACTVHAVTRITLPERRQ
jgi:hypothetical protein